MKKIFTAKKGFSIIEALIAISILTVGLTAAMTLLVGSAQTVKQVNDRIRATYLASEGIEVIRQQRDSNIINHYVNFPSGGPAWDTGFSQCTSSNGGCVVNTINTGTAPTIQSYNSMSPQDDYLYNDDISGAFSAIASSKKTIYERRVTLTAITQGATTIGYNIVSTINYNDHGAQPPVTLRDVIYNTGNF